MAGGSREPILVLVLVGTDRDHPAIAELISSGATLFVLSPAGEVSPALERLVVDKRRPTGRERVFVRFGFLSIDLDSHTASWAGRVLKLSERELMLLSTLAEKPGNAWSYQELQERVWGSKYFGDNGLVRMAIRRLREKLRRAEAPLVIEAVRGFGFRLERLYEE